MGEPFRRQDIANALTNQAFVVVPDGHCSLERVLQTLEIIRPGTKYIFLAQIPRIIFGDRDCLSHGKYHPYMVAASWYGVVCCAKKWAAVLHRQQGNSSHI
ncbi:hypothetical protein CHARACLAT_007622 [Characodon lateralis]|uniref:Uncharacterized protein n=1 Tax=Characodon lateralis TaxID=208331 RepID=A0ABU7D5L4_9TELE|nr:hypothetical protein [Characodon lateralis]